MAWPDVERSIARAVVSAFRETVTLPDGTTVQGMFRPTTGGPSAPWSESGLTVRITDEPTPVLDLLPADAATLAEQLADEDLADSLDNRLTLMIRDAPYRVDHIHPERAGLVRVDLAPDRRTEDTDTEARWQ